MPELLPAISHYWEISLLYSSYAVPPWEGVKIFLAQLALAALLGLFLWGVYCTTPQCRAERQRLKERKTRSSHQNSSISTPR